MNNSMKLPQKLMLLGSGELGKEFVIAAKRFGNYVIAVDRYANAPAMQVADCSEVISMLSADDLEAVVSKYQPDFIIPEIEAIRTEKLLEFEHRGITVIPTAAATNYTMNRDRIRELAHKELGIRTAKYGYATTLEESVAVSDEIGFANVVKPVMSSSGKGQSVVKEKSEVEKAWNYAIANSRGDSQKVIVEEFIDFEIEITLLTIKQWNAPTIFCSPIGHRQERGDYQESWQPAEVSEQMILEAQEIATKVTDALGGAGIFGVEFFVTKDEVIFSELSPRPHDTGMVTLISQNLNEFELHLRAILGLPIPHIEQLGYSASAVILATEKSDFIAYTGVAEALSEKDVDIKLFGKPNAHPYRRMGVALAKGSDIQEAREKANRAASKIKLKYQP
ncbi:MAG: formate-dependent phosphoribosylglycinamide formyltransferase [Brasilonema octagenarum HA4186-MV1]|jgi:phosphoribosylglycinamide formyltransferase 2|uniref:Formate-dependent phosphoribosylglycinamide formyltransferase n=2 Tax=Brasilonema TaxID=383614 RepID=A0A856MDJ1_9CYAN|nr:MULTISPECIES: formate-dependent phosphoribosylglycinamide formyltransferase [Brasilonema]MBW4627721.1 formate-dependent phosphoribosylglycinamide formyltransferase [Brasilonema octagenarum HA4186-MV1]NMF64038.1 phosphoribosylglycinamide formyltransferase 2 [Brasilonema octagenarum UFV-OR1]QDL09253.1 phosphoribosylglycinamide formyltransferase 2 [Brasilonema sennae CENA114]QDL15612.1 phosphoribosylglycinamide formyltransferase 2 [Brasilonema octagenarum UFV-E1]